MVLIIIGIIVILAVIFLSYYGAFTKIEVGYERQGGETLIYEEIKGDYRQSANSMDKVYYALKNDHGIATTNGFGIYYDNPQKVETSKLRSEAGCIIPQGVEIDNDAISEKFKIKQFPDERYIVTSFPYKNKMSVIFSIMRVYPKLREFAEKNGHSLEAPVMEIYDVPNKKILYRMKIK